jgi:hypothetical protein
LRNGAQGALISSSQHPATLADGLGNFGDPLPSFGARQMAFWRKTIDLPQDFYQAAGEDMLYIAERRKAAEQLQSSPMTFDQANEILNLSKQCIARLRALISQYPIKSILSLSMRDQLCETVIQNCEEKINAISALPNVDRSSLICLHGGDIG